MRPESVFKQLRSHLVLVAAGTIALYLSWSNFADRKQEASQAVSQLRACQLQAKAIGQMSDQPVFAVAKLAAIDELTERISEAAKAAGVGEQVIDMVDPRDPTRIRDSAYRIRPVGIHLRGVVFPQIARFTDALTDRDQGMWVSQIRMTPVRSQQDEETEEFWNVELVLTQVNYSPTTRS